MGIPFQQIRKERNMTQEQMAEFLGVPYRTYQAWELGVRHPAPYVIDMIQIKLYGVQNAKIN